MARHHLPAIAPNLHTRWDRSLPPALIVDPGDVVVFETTEGMGGQIRPGTTAADLDGIDRSRLHTLTGPVAVRGARPGDVLAVTVLELVPAVHGANYHRPGVGLLPEEFQQAHLRHFHLDAERRWTDFATGIRLPVRPFMGIYGVAPAQPGAHSTIPPGRHGGNLDCKELGVAAIIYLPVQVEGALFSTGDGHACQGDGEVNVTALEIAMERAEMRLDLAPGMGLDFPRAETPTHHICFGLGSDLESAVRMAVREMIVYLVEGRGLNRDDAYTLCSVAVDLRVTQVVNGVKGVHAMLPKSIFV